MPIISARGIITPATYSGNLACFYGGRRVRKGWDDKQFTALCTHNLPEQIPLHLLRLQLLEVAGIQIKIIPEHPLFYFLNLQQSWAGQSKLHSKNKATAVQV